MHDWTNAQYKYNIENLFIIVLKVSIWFVFFFFILRCRLILRLFAFAFRLCHDFSSIHLD